MTSQSTPPLANALGREVTAPFAEFLISSRYEDIPASVRARARQTLLNSMGASLGGSSNEVVTKFVQTIASLDGPGPVRLLGRSERLALANAAFINGAAAGVLDFDDTHFPTIMHPTATVVGALYALADRRPISGRDFLHAFILGFEAQARIGRSISPYHYAHGFHITSTCGVFGSAVAVGRLLGLDARRMIWAIGNASTQSAGMVKACGFSSKSIGVGNAARGGLLAAYYALAGLDSPYQSLEGRYGYCEVMSKTPDYGAVLDGLGESWELFDNAFKAYPAGIVVHPIIDACLEFRSRLHVAAEDLAQIAVYGNPLMGGLTDRATVSSVREAVVSIQHSAAVAFIDGRVGLPQYGLDRINDPRVRALRDKVKVVEDATMPVGPIRCEIITVGGARREIVVRHWLGSLESPLDDMQIEQKVRELAMAGAPGSNVDRLIELIRDLEDVADVSEIIGATQG